MVPPTSVYPRSDRRGVMIVAIATGIRYQTTRTFCSPIQQQGDLTVVTAARYPCHLIPRTIGVIFLAARRS